MWGKRGHRGDALEDLLTFTHEYYHSLNLCRIDKISTPVKVVEIDHLGSITKGFFEKKSTVDFIGIIQGVFVAFDAKETHLKNLPLKNIHPHQVEYMKDISQQGGLTFIITHFKFNDTYFILPYEIIDQYFYREKRKSIPYEAMMEPLEIKKIRGGSTLDYLPALNQYVQLKSTQAFQFKSEMNCNKKSETP